MLGLASLWLISAHIPLAATTSATEGPYPLDAFPVFSLPSNASWFENLVVREHSTSDFNILATRLDVPQIWSINPKTKEGILLVNVTDTTTLVGITESKDGPDYWIAGLNVSNGAVQPNSSALWKLSYDRDDETGMAFTFTKAFALPAMTLINGLVTWGGPYILAADSRQGAVYRIDTETGDTRVAVQHPWMRPSSPELTGVNGLRYYWAHNEEDGSWVWLYWTNTDLGLMARMPLTWKDADSHLGRAEVLGQKLGPVDDFVVLDDGSAIVATGAQKQQLRIEVGGCRDNAIDRPVEVVSEVAYSTSCQLDKTDAMLYITTGGSGDKGAIYGVKLFRAV